MAACLILLPGALRRREPLAGLLAAVLLAVLVNALVTGGLSGPHARYQSRVMWLPTLAALLALTPSLSTLTPTLSQRERGKIRALAPREMEQDEALSLWERVG